MHDEDDIDIRYILILLWRSRVLIIGCLLIGLAVTAISLSFISPRYKARSVLIVESPAQSITMPSEFQSVQYTPKHDVRILNDIAVLQSRSFAEHVIRSHDALNKLIMTRASLSGRKQSFKQFSVVNQTLDNLPQSMVDTIKNNAISVFLAHLKVRNVPGSSVIHIEYTSSDPIFAANIANAVADTYIKRQNTMRQDKIKHHSAWSTKRLKTLENQMSVAEQAVYNYKRTHNIMGNSDDLSMENAIQLHHVMQSSQNQKDDAAIRLNTFADITEDVQNNDSVTRLKLELTQSEAKIAELKTRYGIKHPLMIKAVSEHNAIENNYKNAVLNVKEQAKNNYDRASKKLETVTDVFNTVRQNAISTQHIRLGLETLERDAKSSRDTYQEFLKAYKRGQDAEALSDSNARILSYAVVPNGASYPNAPLFLSLSAIMALFVGVGLTFLKDSADNTYRHPNMLERDLSIPCRTVIPFISEKLSSHDMGAYVIKNPISAVTEAVKGLKTDLLLKRGDNRSPFIICVTSSLMGEGKTSLSLWLARVFAKSDIKTVLVDCDLRRPRVHHYFDEQPDMTLSDILADRSHINEAILKDIMTDLDVIIGTAMPNTALDTLASDRMKKIIDDLKTTYDVIIIDAPATLPVSDARVLSHYADHVLYTVAAHETGRDNIARGLKQFDHMDQRNTQLVLNKFKD